MLIYGVVHQELLLINQQVLEILVIDIFLTIIILIIKQVFNFVTNYIIFGILWYV